MSQEWQNWQYDAFITIPIIIYFADNNHVILNSLYICIFNSSTINSTSYKLSNVHKKILSVTHMSSHYSIKSFSFFAVTWIFIVHFVIFVMTGNTILILQTAMLMIMIIMMSFSPSHILMFTSSHQKVNLVYLHQKFIVTQYAT